MIQLLLWIIISVQLNKLTLLVWGTSKWKPTFKMNGPNVKFSNQVKYLEIIIDNKLNWTWHLNFLKNINFRTVPGINWFSLLKCWYLTVLESILTYGCSTWGRDRSKHNINKVRTILAISKDFIWWIGYFVGNMSNPYRDWNEVQQIWYGGTSESNVSIILK